MTSADWIAKTVNSVTGSRSYQTNVSSEKAARVSNAPFNINSSSQSKEEQELAAELAAFLDDMKFTATHFIVRGVYTQYDSHRSVYVCPR